MCLRSKNNKQITYSIPTNQFSIFTTMNLPELCERRLDALQFTKKKESVIEWVAGLNLTKSDISSPYYDERFYLESILCCHISVTLRPTDFFVVINDTKTTYCYEEINQQYLWDIERTMFDSVMSANTIDYP